MSAEVFRDEVLKALVAELRKGQELDRQQLEVLRDLRDELALVRVELRALAELRAQREQHENTDPVPIAVGGLTR